MASVLVLRLLVGAGPPWLGPRTALYALGVLRLDERVVDALVEYFCSYSDHAEPPPVLWQQTLLVFAQHYKAEITGEQKESLKALMRAQPHAQITPEIRRELFSARARRGLHPKPRRRRHARRANAHGVTRAQNRRGSRSGGCGAALGARTTLSARRDVAPDRDRRAGDARWRDGGAPFWILDDEFGVNSSDFWIEMCVSARVQYSSAVHTATHSSICTTEYRTDYSTDCTR